MTGVDEVLPGPELSVVVPVRNGEAVLPLALDALEKSDLERERWETIVVIDGGTDRSAELARGRVDQVIELPPPSRGPGYARNRGVAAARGEVVVFVDADVCVHPDTLRRFLEAIRSAPDVAAVFGAYDVDPPAPGLVSQYRNLMHHYTHRIGAGEAETFWAGCGAVRKSVFLEAGGFDEKRYPRPMIEDIELGHRIRDLGYRILLRPEIQSRHLKAWKFWDGIVTDVRDRGVPWMELLLADSGSAARHAALNVRTEEKVYTGLTGLALLAILVGGITGSAAWLAVALVSVLVVVAGNAPLIRWFARHRGAGFALAVVPMRLLGYIVNGVCVALAWVRHLTRRSAATAGRADARTRSAVSGSST